MILLSRPSAKTRAFYLAIGAILLAGSIVVISAGFAQSPRSEVQSLKVVTVPLLSAPQLLANKTLALQYGVTGVLWITDVQSGQLNLQAKPGQTLEIPISLRFVSFSADFPSAFVSFSPSTGQLSQGTVDISSMESYSVQSITVGNQPVVVTLRIQFPTSLAQGSFPIVPTGIDVSPSTGVFVYYDTYMIVSVLP